MAANTLSAQSQNPSNETRRECLLAQVRGDRERSGTFRTVARGTKIMSLADSETRAYTRDMIEMVENLDKVLVAGPQL